MPPRGKIGTRSRVFEEEWPAMPTEPGKIRNVAVTGHRGTGKTSLVEAMLFQAGAINRLGTVEGGTTTSDWDEDEQRRQMSLASSICHLEWQGRKINLIDAPGDAGFAGDTVAALRVVEGALVVASAVMGVEVQTSRVWNARRVARPAARRLREHARPRARRLLPRARALPHPALRALRRRAPADRHRARADGDRRPAAHDRLRQPRRRARERADGDPGGAATTRCSSTGRSCSTRSSRPTRG